ncbi:MAG: hypothetical protein ABSG13_07345 [Bryobacteraceae bacterium]
MFYAFDFLALDGADLRARTLIERKRLLHDIIPDQRLRCFTRTTSKATGRDKPHKIRPVYTESTKNPSWSLG